VEKLSEGEREDAGAEVGSLEAKRKRERSSEEDGGVEGGEEVEERKRMKM